MYIEQLYYNDYWESKNSTGLSFYSFCLLLLEFISIKSTFMQQKQFLHNLRDENFSLIHTLCFFPVNFA